MTRMIAVEFVTMMAAHDRLADAASVLPYLDTTGRFDLLARQSLIADAVHRIDALPPPPPVSAEARTRAGH